MNNTQLKQEVKAAEKRLKQKYLELDYKALGLSEYNEWYLGNKIKLIDSILYMYGRLIYLCLKDTDTNIKDFAIVDYGGGSGVMTLLAKEVGIGTVIYNDIYDVSCNDVNLISEALNLKLDHNVLGDVDDLISYVQKENLGIDAMVSYDVIEHIYDLDLHFSKLKSFGYNNFKIVYATGVNIENPRAVKAVTPKQISMENETREKKYGHKERDALKAYVEIREDIIKAYAPKISDTDAKSLAKATRGLIKEDIEKYVDEFFEKGKISYKIEHPYNTCDPYTGNWCEHFVEHDWLINLVNKHGFKTQILTGRYYPPGAIHKMLVKRGLNFLMETLNRKMMFMSPYYVVYAKTS